MCDGNSLPRESQVTWKWDAFPWGFGKIGVSWKNCQIQVSRSTANGSIPRGHLESLWKLTKTTVSSDFSEPIKSGLSGVISTHMTSSVCKFALKYFSSRSRENPQRSSLQGPKMIPVVHDRSRFLVQYDDISCRSQAKSSGRGFVPVVLDALCAIYMQRSMPSSS